MSNDVVENVKSKTETWLKLRGRHRDFRRKREQDINVRNWDL